MKNPIKALMGKRQKSAAEVEAELAKLGQKLADHKRRRSDHLQAAEEGRTIWRESLAEDDAVIAAAKANVDRLEREADETARTISEYEAAIADAEERFRNAADAERRIAAAAALEATAKKVDAITLELQKAVLSVASAVNKIRAALPKDLGVYEMDYDSRPEGRPERLNDFASGREAVSAVLAEAFFSEMPDLFDVGQVGNRSFVGLLTVGSPKAPRLETLSWNRRNDLGLSTAAAVDVLICSKLRDRAAKIVAGEINPGRDAVNIVEPYRRPDPEPTVRVFVVKHFKFLEGQPGYKPKYRGQSPGSGEYLKAAVAEAAIARKVAVLWDSEEGEKARLLDYSAARGGGGVWGRTAITVPFGPSIDDYFDLGDPLGLERAFKAANDARNNEVEAQEAARALG